jgi:hypothetical protein
MKLNFEVAKGRIGDTETPIHECYVPMCLCFYVFNSLYPNLPTQYRGLLSIYRPILHHKNHLP